MKRISIILIVAIVCSILTVLIVKQINFHNYKTSYKITKEQIEKRILINEITNAINKDCFLKTFSDKEEAEKYITNHYRPTKYEDVVEELSRAELIKAILASENRTIDYNLSKQSTYSGFEQMKTEESQARYYESVKTVLPVFNLNEEEYLELLYDYGYDLNSKTEFNRWFIKESGYYEDKSDPELVQAEEYPGWEEQVEAYIDKAMKKVSVEIE